MSGNSVNCPDCDSENGVDAGAEVGQVVACKCCGTLLEIMSIAPPSVAKAPQIEEDFGE
jgi:alpha-aminoadipate carrier protein LysW